MDQIIVWSSQQMFVVLEISEVIRKRVVDALQQLHHPQSNFVQMEEIQDNCHPPREWVTNENHSESTVG